MRLILAICIAMTLVSDCPAWGEDKLTVDLVYAEQKQIGSVLELPDGRLVFELIRPLDDSPKLILHHSSTQTYNQTILMVIAPDGDNDPELLFEQGENAAFQLAAVNPLSPDGRRLLVFRVEGQIYVPGVFDIHTGNAQFFEGFSAVPHLEVTQWLSNTDFVFLHQDYDGGVLAWGGRYDGPVRQSQEWTKAWRQESVTASPIGSGRYKVPLAERGQSLSRLDTSSGRAASVIENMNIAPVSTSPCGKFLYATITPVGAAGDSSKQQSSQAVIIDYSKSEIVSLLDDMLPEHFVSWSPNGQKLLYKVAARASDHNDGHLVVFDVPRREYTVVRSIVNNPIGPEDAPRRRALVTARSKVFLDN